MAPIPELSTTSDCAQLNDMTRDDKLLRGKVQTANNMRAYYLALVLIAYFVGTVALGNSDPDFYRFGGASVGMALIWAFVAIADVFVSRQQIKLALAILARRSLTVRSQASKTPIDRSTPENTTPLMEEA